MTFALGTATGRIELEYDGTGVRKAEDDVEGLSGNTEKAMGGINKLGTIAGVAGGAIAAGLAVGVNAAANFEQRMSAIGAVSGASGEDLDKLRNKALQLGKDTQFSASESAQAIEELVKAGLSVGDVMNGAADSVVSLAAAGEIGMPEAATIASNAMNQFGIKAEDMVGVVDQIAGASNASAIDVSDLGQALQQVGAVANLAGVNFDDTATAIALMGNAGIKGSDAGTSLKSMLSRLQPTTTAAYDKMNELGLITFSTNGAMKTLAENGIKGVTKTNAEAKLQELAAKLTDSEVGSAKANKEFTKLGLQTGYLANQFYDAQGNTKSLSAVSEELSKSLEGMNARQKQAALQTLFGSDAIRAAAIMSKNGAKGFDEMAASMGKTSAAEVAAKRMDNFKGSMEQMKGSLETAGIAMGTILLPLLRSLVDHLTSALNWFLNLSDGTQKFIVVALAAVAGVLLVIAGIAKMIVFVNTVRTALVALRGTMIATWAATLGPILLVIAVIAAVIAIFVLLYKKNETFRAGVQAIWGAIKKAIKAVVDWIMGVPEMLSSAWDAVKGAMSATKDFFVGIWNSIKDAITTVLNVIKDVVMFYFNFYKNIITTALNVILGIWESVWGLFGPLVKALWGLVVAIIKLGWTIIKGLFILYVRGIIKVFSTAWNIISKIVKVAWNIIKSIVRAGLNFVKGIITGVWNTIKAVTSAVWNAIKAAIQKVWEIIGPFVMQRIENIKNNITRVWNAIKDVTSKVWNGIKDVVGKAIDGVVNLAGNIKDRIFGFFSNAGTWLYDKGKEIIQGLIDGIGAMVSKVTDKVESVTGAIGKFLPGSPVKEGPLKVLNRGYAGKQIVNMILDGMGSGLRPAAVTAGSLGETLLPTVPDVGRAAATATSEARVLHLTVPVYNPVPERAGQSVQKVLRNKVEEEGWGR